LLRYLVEHAVDRPGAPIKEYQIATEVFGRTVDFDPRLDSTVRVQSGRLRSKLSEYYGSKGADDRVILELPRGSYTVSIHERAVPERLRAPPVEPVFAAVAAQPDKLTRRLAVTTWVLGALCLVLLATLLDVVLTRQSIEAPAAAKAPAAFRSFWADFIDGPERPWVVFSNAEFVGRPETGIRYYNAQQDGDKPILDHYTGVGEVLAIHELDGLFASLGHGVRVKRGRLLSIDDAKNNDLIFVGSPSENLSLRQIPGTQDFIFRNADTGPRKGDLIIINTKPAEGEPGSFWATHAQPITEDYAVVGLFRGINSNRWVMVLAGITTLGTQAAVEFVTRENDVRKLLDRTRGGDSRPHPFEAVIRVGVKGGVPVTAELAAFHSRSTQ
jgi:hypothetical protein